MPSLAWGQTQPTFDELMDKGVNLLDQGKYAEALELFDQALEIDEEHIDALYFKGESFFWVEKYDDAVDYFDKVLEIDPNDVYALYFKGLSLNALEKKDEGIILIQKAIEIDPYIVEQLNEEVGIDQPLPPSSFTTTTYSAENPTISIVTDRTKIVPGNFIGISGTVRDMSGNLAKAKVVLEVIHVKPRQENIVYKASFFTDGEEGFLGTFYDNGANIKEVGDYKIKATTSINGFKEDTLVHLEVVNLFYTVAAGFAYLGIAAFVFFIIIILKTMTSKPTVREILRFVCITVMAVTPAAVFALTDVEIGQNGPFGLVVFSPTDSASQFFNYEWVINIGGYYPYYETGVQIPIFVLIFGVAGGYIRYLHTTYKLFAKESVLVKVPEKEGEEMHKVRIEVLHQSMKDLALLFLAPLLAIAAYFLLIQSGIEQNNYETIAAVSFGVGLVTDNVVARLENIVGQKLKNGATGKKKDG